MTEQHHAFDAFDKQCEDLRDKWLRHRAKPEQWTQIEYFAKSWSNDSCILELRSRVEVLELWRATTGNTAPATRDRAEDAPASSDSLVEQLAIVCAMPAKWTWDDQARATIHATADWLDQQGLHSAATRLRMEVEQ
jgi:hypothetical protein